MSMTVCTIIVKVSSMYCSFKIYIPLQKQCPQKNCRNQVSTIIFCDYNCMVSEKITIKVQCHIPVRSCLYAYGDVKHICTNIYIGIIWKFSSYGSILFVLLRIEDCRMCQLNYFYQILYVHSRMSPKIKIHIQYTSCWMKIIILSYSTRP